MTENKKTDENTDFESEFSFYIKAYERARNEISESIKLQYDAIKIGLTFLASISAAANFLNK